MLDFGSVAKNPGLFLERDAAEGFGDTAAHFLACNRAIIELSGGVSGCDRSAKFQVRHHKHEG